MQATCRWGAQSGLLFGACTGKGAHAFAASEAHRDTGTLVRVCLVQAVLGTCAHHRLCNDRLTRRLTQQGTTGQAVTHP